MNKYLLPALLAMCCTNAYGKAVAYIPNQAGGRIVITDQPCLIGKQAFATDAQGDTHAGCWTYGKAYIYIKWVDVPKALPYPITMLTRMEDVI